MAFFFTFSLQPRRLWPDMFNEKFIFYLTNQLISISQKVELLVIKEECKHGRKYIR